uniref:Uncharacterized protein n=1 Tax=Tanacetum cinerariifolium TaxID=118510 RepID=A0A6L2JZQ5_TANCI|nr:hypothetical protein [Tanacetum cinerariifolium]
MMPKIEKYVTETLGVEVLVRTTNQPQTTYAVAASLSEFKLKKILIDKMEANKSINRSDTQKNLYNALVKSYNSEKDIITSYGDVVLLKKGRDNQDKDKDPSAGSDRGTKRRKFEEPSHTVEELGMQQDQEFITGDNNEQSIDKETWITQATLTNKPLTSFDEFNDTSFDFSAFVLNRLKILNLTQEILVGLAFNLLKGTCKSIMEVDYHFEECSKATAERLDWHNLKHKPYPFDLHKPLLLLQDHRGRQIIPKDYFINKDLEYLKGGDSTRRYSTSMTKIKAVTYELIWIKDLVPKLRRIIAVTRLTIMKKYDYGNLKEIEVLRDDQQLYAFKEGNFKKLRLQDNEHMLLLLVQQKLTNLIIDERLDLNVALRMFTRCIVIQRRSKRKILMRTDELHKFSDGTLNDVRTTLHDVAAGLRMNYLPMRRWSNLDKKRARVMVQDIDKQLYQRRLMRNLENFIGGRPYGEDLRLLGRTI